MDLKKIANDAGTFFSRAKQFTEEKLGHAEKTELDAHIETLLDRADKTKLWTERMIKDIETLIQPNPAARMQDMVYEKVQGNKPIRFTSNDLLGVVMIDSGNDLGAATAYGGALVKCGQAQQQIASANRQFIETTANNFLTPLRAFLDGDMKTIEKERKVLESKRLDLDAAKSRVKRASVSTKDTVDTDLRIAQQEFDRQLEVIKLLLQGISSIHAHHLRCLQDFIESQMNFYAKCHEIMTNLQKDTSGR